MVAGSGSTSGAGAAADHAALLGGTRVFAGLARTECERLARRAVLRRYRRDETVVLEGDPGTAMYVIVTGSLKVYVTSVDGAELVLATLGPGDAMGEISVVDGGARSASAQALEPSTLLVLTRDDLLAALREHPPVAEALLRSLGALVRRLTDQAADLVFLDLNRRVAKLLCSLFERRDQATETVDLHLTQTELASMVGGSRQSVNQILRALEKAGVVAIESHRLRVLDWDVLRERAGLD